MATIQRIRDFLTTRLISFKSPTTPLPGKTGQLTPTSPLPVSKPSVEQSLPVSQPSEPKGSSIERNDPMLTLTQVAAAVVNGALVVETAVTAVGVLITDVKKIVAYIPDLMQTFENAYAQVGQANNGAGKLAGVLAALEAIALKIGAVWTESVKSLIADIISQAKAAYNAVASVVKGSSTALPNLAPAAV